MPTFEKSPHVFVYGTLRPGASRAALPTGLARMLALETVPAGPARVRGHLLRVADYPALVLDEEAGWVIGDLLRMTNPAPLLAALDAYEECSADFPQPHEYRRVLIDVQSPEGPVPAWAWLYARTTDGLPIIESGDFLNS
ncbi:gamma-glutamylcyclotransferase family protein [Sphingobium subterraneum]|uniref:Gamma-glutamylcyclotransferase (GGCT)/AIG2-like uncharacterized protein YtfP n=1 Tax=Sphingobium subterraneum TaxID=627688 RepID=A0A841IZK1_9SPHN|nr:gamma-glutamylcyclotransferase family protein [Sphingobium subterraneum]MBB6124399.1 gamma-glutamylcyclotransferase (GGCT)/AIG2-like uncharacterized protein YtfP [Sphingobium subterraneum]